MKYYQLSNTQYHVSAIGMGCMRIANKSVQEVEELIDTALDCGINFFDHADIYGGGKSEEVFGEVLAKRPELREKMIIQSKCGIVPGKRYDFSKDYIINAVNGTLERLQTDYLDLLLLHRPDALCDYEEVADAFNTLNKEGKVCQFGVSNHTAGQVRLLQMYANQSIVANQLQFSIVHSGMIDSGLHMNMTEDLAVDKDGGVLDFCRFNEIMIQAWSPLQASWSEGTFIDNPHYPQLNEELAKLSKKYQVTKAAIAVAWILRHPAHMQVISGTASPIHLREMCEATNIQLTRQEWYDLYLASGKTLP